MGSFAGVRRVSPACPRPRGAGWDSNSPCKVLPCGTLGNLGLLRWGAGRFAGKGRGVSIILRTPATCLHSHSLLHPQLHSPAPTSSRCSRGAGSRLCGSTPAPVESHFLAQPCPSPAPVLSGLRAQLDQSGKTSWCSPQLVPPQIPAAQLWSLASSSGPPGAKAGSQPSLSVLGDPPTSQPQAGKDNWGSPNLGSNW